MTDLLTSAFGTKTPIVNTVKEFDWSKIDLTSTSTSDALIVPLAPSPGKLSAKTVRTLPVHTKVALAGTLLSIGKVPAARRGYAEALATMLQNVVIEHVTGSDEMLSITKVLKKKANTDVFGSGTANTAAVDEVKEWLAELPTGDSIAELLNIDFDAITNLVAEATPVPPKEDDENGQERASEDDEDDEDDKPSKKSKTAKKPAKSEALDKKIFKAGVALLDLRHGKHEKTIVDVGALRFPTAKVSTLKIYRIKITVWAQTQQTISFLKETVAGISAEYTSRDFEPRDTMISQLSEVACEKAINFADELFD